MPCIAVIEDDADNLFLLEAVLVQEDYEVILVTGAGNLFAQVTAARPTSCCWTSAWPQGRWAGACRRHPRGSRTPAGAHYPHVGRTGLFRQHAGDVPRRLPMWSPSPSTWTICLPWSRVNSAQPATPPSSRRLIGGCYTQSIPMCLDGATPQALTGPGVRRTVKGQQDGPAGGQCGSRCVVTQGCAETIKPLQQIVEQRLLAGALHRLAQQSIVLRPALPDRFSLQLSEIAGLHLHSPCSIRPETSDGAAIGHPKWCG